jgi:hypothetical protein
MLFLSSLAFLCFVSAGVGAAETFNCPQVQVDYPQAACGNTPLWTMDEVRRHSEDTACLMVLYDTVYEVKGFANIHRYVSQ